MQSHKAKVKFEMKCTLLMNTYEIDEIHNAVWFIPIPLLMEYIAQRRITCLHIKMSSFCIYCLTPPPKYYPKARHTSSKMQRNVKVLEWCLSYMVLV